MQATGTLTSSQAFDGRQGKPNLFPHSHPIIDQLPLGFSLPEGTVTTFGEEIFFQKLKLAKTAKAILASLQEFLEFGGASEFYLYFKSQCQWYTCLEAKNPLILLFKSTLSQRADFFHGLQPSDFLKLLSGSQNKVRPHPNHFTYLFQTPNRIEKVLDPWSTWLALCRQNPNWIDPFCRAIEELDFLPPKFNQVGHFPKPLACNSSLIDDGAYFPLLKYLFLLATFAQENLEGALKIRNSLIKKARLNGDDWPSLVQQNLQQMIIFYEKYTHARQRNFSIAQKIATIFKERSFLELKQESNALSFKSSDQPSLLELAFAASRLFQKDYFTSMLSEDISWYLAAIKKPNLASLKLLALILKHLQDPEREEFLYYERQLFFVNRMKQASLKKGEKFPFRMELLRQIMLKLDIGRDLFAFYDQGAASFLQTCFISGNLPTDHPLVQAALEEAPGFLPQPEKEPPPLPFEDTPLDCPGKDAQQQTNLSPGPQRRLCGKRPHS
ncbi:MAG: hypothetical protein K0S07_968 [Chlamydiales bacterium]|jgi:hypothetical protein|nr:hypothetical protein [Chlamydiales bacterium]